MESENDNTENGAAADNANATTSEEVTGSPETNPADASQPAE